MRSHRDVLRLHGLFQHADCVKNIAITRATRPRPRTSRACRQCMLQWPCSNCHVPLRTGSQILPSSSPVSCGRFPNSVKDTAREHICCPFSCNKGANSRSPVPLGMRPCRMYRTNHATNHQGLIRGPFQVDGHLHADVTGGLFVYARESKPDFGPPLPIPDQLRGWCSQPTKTAYQRREPTEDSPGKSAAFVE